MYEYVKFIHIWIFRVDFLYDWLVGSPCSPRDSQESSLTPQFQKHQFFHAQHSVNCDAIYMKVYGKSYKIYFLKISFQFSSITQSYPAVCNPMECSTPGLPVHHQLPELAQTHVRWVSDAIQPSHPLSSPSSPAFNLAQDQVAKVLEFQLQHQTSFRAEWFDLLAVQRTLKSLLQHHSSKASSL